MGRLIAVIAAVLVAVFLSSILVVNEGERAIVSRFGKILKDDGVTRIYSPGLHLKIPMIDKIKMDDRDTKGDLYEYLLSKIAHAGTNGQFRTPRHIIKMMVELMKWTHVYAEFFSGSRSLQRSAA